MQKSLLTKFSIPVTVPPTHELATFSTDIRLFVSKTKGTRVSVCINLPGTTKMITFPAENKIAGKELIKTIREKIVTIRGLAVRSTEYVAHVLICIERCNAECETAVHIDSFDIAANLRKIR
jgi:sulfite reductase beta subunit-like hemoprotein